MAVHINTNNSQAVWRRLEKLPRREGADIQMSALFYRAVVQAVLIVRSEPWALLYVTIRTMERFQVVFLSKITWKR